MLCASAGEPQRVLHAMAAMLPTGGARGSGMQRLGTEALEAEQRIGGWRNGGDQTEGDERRVTD